MEDNDVRRARSRSRFVAGDGAPHRRIDMTAARMLAMPAVGL
jgi:hypothetical protein